MGGKSLPKLIYKNFLPNFEKVLLWNSCGLYNFLLVYFGTSDATVFPM